MIKTVDNICDLTMVKAEYGHVLPSNGSPIWVYQISIAQNGATGALFDVSQATADELANELGTLASLIRAHTRHREPE